MDLLGGYGSDSDSDSDSSNHDNVNVPLPPPQPQRQPTMSSSSPSKPHTASTANTDSKRVVMGNSHSKLNVNANAREKKGRRILKLNAVLPPEILDRLTRNGGGNGTSSEGGINVNTDTDTDSSDDEVVGDTATHRNSNNVRRDGNINRQKKRIGIFPQHHQKLHSEDAGLHSLLSDLQGVAPESTTATKSATMTTVKSEPKQEKMGFAFMNVSSSTIIRNRSRGNNAKHEVIDIHSQGSSRGHKQAAADADGERVREEVVVEDVTSENSSDDDDHDEKDNHHPAQPLFPSPSSNHSAGRSTSSESGPTNNKPNPRYSNHNNTRSYTYTSSTPSSSILGKRTIGTVRHVDKAPLVSRIPKPPSSLSAGFIRNNHVQPSTTSTTTGVMPHAHHSPSSQIMQPGPSQSTKRKMSKKELEKALRSGNFDAIETQKIDSINYVSGGAEGALAASIAGASMENESSSFGIGAAAATGGITGGGLETYTPSEGMAVKQKGYHSVTSKQKGKNQIHSLVSSAAKLEADHRRMAAIGRMAHGGGPGAGAGAGKSRRADAKRKYGW